MGTRSNGYAGGAWGRERGPYFLGCFQLQVTENSKLLRQWVFVGSLYKEGLGTHSYHSERLPQKRC
jgi:hypothetical protein